MIKTALSCKLKWSNQFQHFIGTYANISSDTLNGLELIIEYGSFLSPFGKCFLAKTQFGICKLAFFDTKFEESLIEKELHSEFVMRDSVDIQWQRASLSRDNTQMESLSAIIFSKKEKCHQPIQLLLQGSQFQLNVWKTLLSIPKNQLVSFQAVAAAMLQPNAVRAVASAIAKNKIAYLIPCHRVIRKNGDVGQYRWKASRKKELIAWDLDLMHNGILSIINT